RLGCGLGSGGSEIGRRLGRGGSRIGRRLGGGGGVGRGSRGGSALGGLPPESISGAFRSGAARRAGRRSSQKKFSQRTQRTQRRGGLLCLLCVLCARFLDHGALCPDSVSPPPVLPRPRPRADQA